jgi:hypothetical protein
MAYKSHSQWVLILFTGLFLTCKQSIDFLPPATQTGQNTIGCLIDGKDYVPDGGGRSLYVRTPPVVGGLSARYRGPGTAIRFFTFSSSKQSIEIYLDDHLLGKHLLNTEYSKAVLGGTHYGVCGSGNSYFYTSPKYTGWVNVSKSDTVSGIVSGTFEFTGADLNGNTVSITNGRFDLNARTQK